MDQQDVSIYLDYNATTPIDEEVAEAMKPYLFSFFGNPSSSHSYGTTTKKAIENARKQVAALLKCHVDEIFFTSGGSESNNYAIMGGARRMKRLHGLDHIVTSCIEHPAVLEVCKALEVFEGFRVTFLPVDKYGMVSCEEVERAVTDKTALVTIMHTNNEVGTFQPIAEIVKIVHKINKKTLIHCDGAQSVGKAEFSVSEMGVDLFSVAAHKFYGPKGVGALFIRRGVELDKILHGADHERNHRPGTENVLELVGLGMAAQIAERDLKKNLKHMSECRDLLFDLLKEGLGEDNVRVNGHPEKRLCNTLNVTLRGIDATTLLADISDRVAASAGAACHSEDVTVSHVLAGMGITVDDALCTIRLSVGRYSTPENIREAAKVIVQTGKLIRTLVVADDDGDDGGECSILDAKDVRLTSTTHGLGCGCKIGMIQLEKILSQIPIKKNANVLVGTNTSDDAGVYKITDDIAIVETVDFFTPICDDPIEFGEIAAANAMSDVYAMGGVPICALNLVAFPVQRLPSEVMRDILLGAQKKADEAGCMIVGGHTIEDSEPKFGMCVTGTVHPEKIWRNVGARDGDVLLLTKPIGLGILTTAMKRKMCTDQAKEIAIKTMSHLNRYAMEAFLHFDVHACTDVTGFGLLGHLLEMVRGTPMHCTVHSDMVPLLSEVEELAIAGVIPGGTQNNVKYVESFCTYDDAIPPHIRIILNDAQTSGGLMVAIAKEHMQSAIEQCKSMGVDVWYIGDFDEIPSTADKGKPLRVVE